jgi:hypothetical protein
MKNKTVLAKNSIALIGLALVFAAAGLLHRFGGPDLTQPGEVSVDAEGDPQWIPED